MDMAAINAVVNEIDSFVWGPVMLVLLVGTGAFLTFYLKFRTWRNLPYAISSVLSKEARTTKRGTGDVSPFSALCSNHRYRQYRRCRNGNVLRRPGRPGVDVDFRMLRPYFQILRMYAGY